jgi:cytochrome c5
MRIFAASFTAFTLAIPFAVQAAERTGEEVVKMQCVKCHGTGVNGAPRIDDRAAWTPRMRQGFDAAVRSAIHGHGKMPARGGMADLTDGEVRAAIAYMFYPAGASLNGGPANGKPPHDPHVKVVGGMEVRIGVVPAEATDVQPRPSGNGYYHLNVSLHDAATQAEIHDAQIEARVSSPMSGDTKALNPLAANNAVSYGNFFRLRPGDSYGIALHIRRNGSAVPTDANFEFSP